MSYNGGLEDPQSWPFSVRYTASPYRKSKFPVDGTVKTSTTASVPTRDTVIPSSVDPLSLSNNLIPAPQQHPHPHQILAAQHHFQTQPSSHWLSSSGENNPENANAVTTAAAHSAAAFRGHLVQNSGSSSVINSGGIISRTNNNNNNCTTTSSSSSTAAQQLGALLPLHQVVPHHQANQPLFAQALVNYHNTQNNSSSGGGPNFRQHLHNQRQLQFHKGGASGTGGRLGGMSLESAHFHPHQQYQNQERQKLLQLQQQRLLLGSSGGSSVATGGGGHFHALLRQTNGQSGNGLVAQNSSATNALIVNKSSMLPDHHHYGLPISAGGNQVNHPGGLLGAQILTGRNGSCSGAQHLRQGNAVWHLLTENKDLDQVSLMN